MDKQEYPVMLFDGVCNLCNASVNRIIRNDPKAIFRFAPLQSETGRQLLHSIGTYEGEALSSIVLVENERHYIRSSAVLRIARKLQWPMNWYWAFIIVPRPLRDLIYKWVAKNRYHWFGRTEACMVPTEDVKARFLEMS